MGFVRSFLAASIPLKVSLFICLLCVAFAWTSFVTASWGDGYTAVNNFKGYGLWSRCGNSETSPNCEKLVGWNLQWYRAVQAFAILAFVSVNLVFLLILFLVFLPACQGGRSVTIWTCVLAFWAALAYIIAIIVFGASFDGAFTVTNADDQTVAYGWGLAIAVAVLEIIIGVLMIFDIRRVHAKLMDL